MPEPRKIILSTYSFVGFAVLIYLAYRVWTSDGGMGLFLLPPIGMAIFACCIWPLSLLFLGVYWKRRRELMWILFPWLIASSGYVALVCVAWGRGLL